MRAGSHRQAGPDLQAVLVAPGSTLSRKMLMLSHFHLYGELRFSGVMGWRNCPSGLCEDDDDAIETLGPLNESACKFLNICGRKIGDNTGNNRSTSFLFQRISVLDQRCSAVLLNDSFGPNFTIFIVFDIILMQTSFL